MSCLGTTDFTGWSLLSSLDYDRCEGHHRFFGERVQVLLIIDRVT